MKKNNISVFNVYVIAAGIEPTSRATVKDMAAIPILRHTLSRIYIIQSCSSFRAARLFACQQYKKRNRTFRSLTTTSINEPSWTALVGKRDLNP